MALEVNHPRRDRRSWCVPCAHPGGKPHWARRGGRYCNRHGGLLPSVVRTDRVRYVLSRIVMRELTEEERRHPVATMQRMLTLLEGKLASGEFVGRDEVELIVTVIRMSKIVDDARNHQPQVDLDAEFRNLVTMVERVSSRTLPAQYHAALMQGLALEASNQPPRVVEHAHVEQPALEAGAPHPDVPGERPTHVARAQMARPGY